MGVPLMRILIKCVLNCSLTKSINPNLESAGLPAPEKGVVGEGRAVSSDGASTLNAQQKSCTPALGGRLARRHRNVRRGPALAQLGAPTRCFLRIWPIGRKSGVLF